MTSDNAFYASDVWRIFWRENVFQWLRERQQYNEFDLDSCLTKLEEDPTVREAALAAFWGTYLANEVPAALNDTQLERIKKLFDYSSLPSSHIEHIKDLATVKLHLASLLVTCLIRPDWPIIEYPSAVIILGKALEAYRLTDPPGIDIDDPHAWGKQYFDEDLFIFSIELVVGIARVELSLIRAEQRNFEEALSLITEGAWGICATTIEGTPPWFSESIPGFEPYLPHSGHHFDIQEAANIFENVKRHHRDIKNWEHIKLYCEVLQYLGYQDLYDFLSDIRDATGEEFGAIEYWGKAITFAEDQIRIVASPLPIVTKDAIEWAETKERMKRDFLRGTWSELTEESRKILVDAEIEWMHNRPDNMVKEIRPLLELVLPTVFLFLEPAIKQKSDGRLILTRMRDELLKNKWVQASIDGLKIDSHHKKWAKEELPHFLSDIIDARNYFEKEQYLPGKDSCKRQYLDKAIGIHSKLLGIGCEGVLPRLLKIKQTTVSKSEGSNKGVNSSHL